MPPLSLIVAVTALLQALCAFTSAAQSPQRAVDVDAACTVISVRKPWDQLTSAEKSDYLQAELCLQDSSERLGIEGAQNLWDDLQFVHITMVAWIHFVGAFLPFHRYFIVVHENLLRSECSYSGPFPYWDEPYDQAHGLVNSTLLTGNAFGGNGSGDNNCVTDGAFANLTLHMEEDQVVGDYCLSRNLAPSEFEKSSQAHVETCLNETTFIDMWDCVEQTPHAGGHGGVAGTMINVAESPGDPLFWLHHTFVDALWARWQAADPDNRTFWIGGTNRPTLNFTGDPAAFIDYDGDPGNVTTLNHTLTSLGLAANKTALDVMNISSVANCATYVYADDI